MGKFSQIARVAARRLCDPRDRRAALAVAAALLVGEALLCAVIVARVPYTEIDWRAYMEQVEAVAAGERDYRRLRGGTGPLVYPAGFVWLFSGLRRATGGGAVPAAQLVYAALYVATQALAMAAYVGAAATPPWALALLCASKRLHSVFVLRLFNDCWAAAAALAGALALQRRRWVLAVLLFSAGVSVKMSVLLLAPGALAVAARAAPRARLAAAAAAGAALQAGLAAPFLAAAPRAYLGRAFEFGRVFDHTWTVNWKFVPPAAFASRPFAAALLLVHAALLWHIFLGFRRRARPAPGRKAQAVPAAAAAAAAEENGDGEAAWAAWTLDALWAANLAGVAAARSLHFQFYAWYAHSLPWLALRFAPGPRRAGVPLLALPLLAGVEAVWGAYPPTPATSGALLLLHAALLGGVLARAPLAPAPAPARPRARARPLGRRGAGEKVS